MLLLKLAIMNIRRNPRRSIITILALAVGLAALIFLWAFMDGYQEQQRENAIKLFSGHIQIHAKGFNKKPLAELIIPEREKVLEKIKNFPQIVSFTERTRGEALIGTTKSSTGAWLFGVDVERESQVTEITRQTKGGDFLLKGEDRKLVIGSDLAQKIGVEIGDKVVVMTQSMDGNLCGSSYRVKSLYHSGTAFDKVAVFITLNAAQELFGFGKETQEVVIQLKNRDAIDKVLPELKNYLNLEKYEVMTWDEIIPEINQWANWSGAIVQAMLMIVMFVIGVGIMNTILMSLFERTKELGVMMAIGTKPAQIIQLIFLETLVIEAVGILVGVIAGYAITFYFQSAGIHFHGFEEAAKQAFMSPVVYPLIRVHRTLDSIVTLLIITSFISLYPAWKASRMEPVKAIYHS
jgi:putative ABC transport system permease protein